MKALTLRQPWASLVAAGAKRLETRSWTTKYRGPLAIHAAKGFSREERDLCYDEPFASCLIDEPGVLWSNSDELPTGCVIATVTLEMVARISRGFGPRREDDIYLDHDLTVISDQERAFGNYRAGRYAWFLSAPERLAEPIPAKGQLGLWTFNHPGLPVQCENCGSWSTVYEGAAEGWWCNACGASDSDG